jgi:hypothetical protein
VAFVLLSLSTLEQLATHDYARAGNAPVATEEQSHMRLLRALTQGRGGMEGGALAQLEERHRSAGGNACAPIFLMQAVQQQ